MNWEKLGLIWNITGDMSWAKSHAMGPTPILLDDDTIRVYYTSLDAHGRGRPSFIDVDAKNPKNIKYVHRDYILDIGKPGSFDDNGLMVTSVLNGLNNRIFMYYAGFEICTNIRYRILSGLAVSEDGGLTFHRVSRAPILERSNTEQFFRGGPFVLHDNDIFKLWYVAGSEWIELDGKEMPTYDIRYLESTDGINWHHEGLVTLPITQEDEHGFGRPWILKESSGSYKLFYSVRRKSFAAYRLGYAESEDGVNWDRRDLRMGLDVSDTGFDSDAIMYSAVINVDKLTYCFYNGNNFGESGIAVAVLKK